MGHFWPLMTSSFRPATFVTLCYDKITKFIDIQLRHHPYCPNSGTAWLRDDTLFLVPEKKRAAQNPV